VQLQILRRFDAIGHSTLSVADATALHEQLFSQRNFAALRGGPLIRVQHNFLLTLRKMTDTLRSVDDKIQACTLYLDGLSLFERIDEEIERIVEIIEQMTRAGVLEKQHKRKLRVQLQKIASAMPLGDSLLFSIAILLVKFFGTSQKSILQCAGFLSDFHRQSECTMHTTIEQRFVREQIDFWNRLALEKVNGRPITFPKSTTSPEIAHARVLHFYYGVAVMDSKLDAVQNGQQMLSDWELDEFALDALLYLHAYFARPEPAKSARLREFMSSARGLRFEESSKATAAYGQLQEFLSCRISVEQYRSFAAALERTTHAEIGTVLSDTSLRSWVFYKALFAKDEKYIDYLQVFAALVPPYAFSFILRTRLQTRRRGLGFGITIRASLRMWLNRM
jgi:hypothetical protein